MIIEKITKIGYSYIFCGIGFLVQGKDVGIAFRHTHERIWLCQFTITKQHTFMLNLGFDHLKKNHFFIGLSSRVLISGV